MKELMNRLKETIKAEGIWKPTIIQGFRIVSVDFTGFRRLAVKKLIAKAYFSDVNGAIRAVPVGMIASVGEAEWTAYRAVKKTQLFQI
ncbi:MAG: hypothetical protein M5U34_23410 [Chloroflexi bacterium]|nr:hypothetical protein [Chloroflexota bacterium]